MGITKHFELIGLPIPCVFILKDNTRLDLRLGFPSATLQGYREGLWCLGLLPGAEVLFKKDDTNSIINLIKAARRKEDIDILLLAKKNKAIEAAAEARLLQLESSK